MTDTITLCPDYISSSIHISKKNTKKGIYIGFEYYVGFEKKTKYGYFNEEEKQQIMEDIEKEKNNFNTLLTINKNDITSEIIKHFRYTEPIIEYEENPINIDPYILGVWLGDGDSVRPALTNIDIPIIEVWKNYGESIGYNITTSNTKERKTSVNIGTTSFIQSYHIVKPKGSGINNIFKDNLKKYNLLSNKHIPDEYLYNTIDNRLKLLAGLIDTDGSFARQTYEISQKNENLSNDIIKLCRSLGFYTRFIKGEKSCMYNGEKKIGIYYRIIISLNQFSIEIPVLLERKKWKYQGLIQKNICNPFIDINGNILEKKIIKWNEIMKIKLYSITEKIKKTMPNETIPWNRYEEFDSIFKDCSPRALDTMYFKTLLPQKEKYDKLIIDINIEIIKPEWFENYNQIKTKLENGENITRTNDQYLYNWLYNEKKICLLKKKELIDELHQKLISMNSDIVDYENKFTDLCNFIETNKKTPIEGTQLGNFLKGLKRDYKNKEGSVYNNITKRKLWENIIEKYDDIINSHNSAKKIKIIFADGTEQIFQSQNDVAQFLNCSKTTINKYLKNKELYKGNKLILI
jgi:predicted transcriptional regulator YheO